MSEQKPTVVFPVKNQFSQEEMERIAELIGATIEETPEEKVPELLKYDSLDEMIHAIREHIAATGESVVSRDIPTGPLIGFQAESGKYWAVGLKAIREVTNETLRRAFQTAEGRQALCDAWNHKKAQEPKAVEQQDSTPGSDFNFLVPAILGLGVLSGIVKGTTISTDSTPEELKEEESTPDLIEEGQTLKSKGLE